MESKGDDLYSAAEKKLNSSGFFELFTGRSGRYQSAAEMFEKAGHLFKMEENLVQAGRAYQRAAECHEKLGSRYEQASFLIKAAKLHQGKETVPLLEQALGIYLEEGHFAQAAKCQKAIAVIWEEQQEFELAREAYRKAEALYRGEDSPNSANACRIKMAELSARLKDYADAAELFEKLDSHRWHLKEHLFSAALCRLAQLDSVATKRALLRYIDLSSEFATSREHELVDTLRQAMEESDLDGFTKAVGWYLQGHTIDQWRTDLLAELKDELVRSEEMDFC